MTQTPPISPLALETYALQLARSAKIASRHYATLSTRMKNNWLHTLAKLLRDETETVLQANVLDMERGREAELSEAFLERLLLTQARLEAMAASLDVIAALPDPIGQLIEGHVRPSGLEVSKVRVPLGVLLFIYESRPNVTIEAAALALKSGNAIILRGGKEAQESNRALHSVMKKAAAEVGIPADGIAMVSDTDRRVIRLLLHQADCIDLAIPRGGEGLIREVQEQAKMPVLKHFRGNCHMYVDQAADLEMAWKLVIDAKCQRPSTCNALESLLVHTAVAERFLPSMAQLFDQHGVDVRACAVSKRLMTHARPATEEDYSAEYLDLIISVKVVESVEQAIDHIEQYGSHHTDAIVTADLPTARKFVREVDSAAVIVNASTRLNDGGELGLGAEIGISTDKFHARGPCGLVELTTYKYVVLGSGQRRADPQV